MDILSFLPNAPVDLPPQAQQTQQPDLSPASSIQPTPPAQPQPQPQPQPMPPPPSYLSSAPSTSTSLDQIPVSIDLDRLTFSFDPSGADLAPLVLGNGQPVFTSMPLTQSAPSQAGPAPRSRGHQRPSPIDTEVYTRIGPDGHLASPVSPRVLGGAAGAHRAHPYRLDSKSHPRSPSAASDRSPGHSPGASPLSGGPTTLPVPSPHSPSSVVSPVGSEHGPSRPGSAAGSRASAGSPGSLASPSVLSAPHSAASGASRWSTSDAGLAELSLVDRPIHNLKVTTAKTKAASVSRRKAAAPFKCPVPGCESSFTRALNLRGHLRSHTDERPYACRYCDRSFARAHDKRRHEKLHLNIRPHTCEYCGKMFARLDALNRHHRQEGDMCVARSAEGNGPGVVPGQGQGSTAPGASSTAAPPRASASAPGTATSPAVAQPTLSSASASASVTSPSAPPILQQHASPGSASLSPPGPSTGLSTSASRSPHAQAGTGGALSYLDPGTLVGTPARAEGGSTWLAPVRDPAHAHAHSHSHSHSHLWSAPSPQQGQKSPLSASGGSGTALDLQLAGPAPGPRSGTDTGSAPAGSSPGARCAAPSAGPGAAAPLAGEFEDTLLFSLGQLGEVPPTSVEGLVSGLSLSATENGGTGQLPAWPPRFAGHVL